jgi:hypothetical protein
VYGCALGNWFPNYVQNKERKKCQRGKSTSWGFLCAKEGAVGNMAEVKLYNRFVLQLFSDSGKMIHKPNALVSQNFFNFKLYCELST